MKTDISYLKEFFTEEELEKGIVLTPEHVSELKAKYKLILEKREREAKIADELKQKQFEEAQRQKAKIEFSDDLANEICERVSGGELVLDICNDYHMPTLKRAMQWLKTHQDFAMLFAQAIQDRLNIFEEEVVKIADDATQDFKEVVIKNVRKRVIDPEVISRAKLRIDVRFKHLRAGRPSKWGETSTIVTKSDAEEDPSQLTNEELEKRIADIESKDRILKSAK